MAQSFIQVSKKQNVQVGHVCSQCEHPVAFTVHIKADVRKSINLSTPSSESAYQVADTTANQAILDFIQKIKKSPTLLSRNMVKNDTISNGHYCHSEITKFDTPCPYCGNYEPWQSSILSEKRISELSEFNFPKVFSTFDDLKNWAMEFNHVVIQKIEAERSSEEKVSCAQEEAIQLHTSICELKKQKETISELKQKESLTIEHAKLVTQKQSLTFWDFATKKELDEKIKYISIQLQNINKIISDKTSILNKKIESLDLELQTVQPLAYGCTGNSKIRNYNNGQVFLVEANDIPTQRQEFLPHESENSSDKTQSSVPQTHKEIETKYAPSNNVFCRKCGFKLLPNSDFCTKCGTKIINIQQ